MNQLIPVNDIQTMAVAVVKSQLFGMKTVEQATALMLIAQAEGYHPALAARDYHIIQGRPTLKAETMMARFQQQGGKVEWKTLTDTEVTAVFSHPSGGSASITWTFEQAKKAGLTNKDNWKNYPRAMLRARVVSEGIRTVYPGVVLGVYTPEEVQDIPGPPPLKDMGSAVFVEPSANHSAEEEEKPDYPFSLLLTDGTVYQGYADFGGYLEGIRTMVEKITKSGKFTPEEKAQKITSLLTANSKQIEALPTLYKIQLKGALIGEGSDLPKVLGDQLDQETLEDL
jgi:RecT family